MGGLRMGRTLALPWSSHQSGRSALTWSQGLARTLQPRQAGLGQRRLGQKFTR